ncbi:hypothetical protein [Streptomyces radiopugnans]|uniref:DUF4232 domain-containing protein n=1 Tax=Streptomyces radiopugnans TaxID=403935 RepID=A0A1H9CPP3_9ACTN|nr:hypothetical protein [Streptomyces radiopugnans]SEQ02603.1 hypothetical protein SAMN05216481_103335 [Streptomyces radiopugnans]
MSGDGRHEEQRDPQGGPGAGHGPGGERKTTEPEPGPSGRASGDRDEGEGRDGREPDASGPVDGSPANGDSADGDRAGEDPAGPAADPDAPVDPAGLDERSLRLMLRGAVEDVAPAPDALERLHHAVPARRARRRQLTVGAAAAALVIGVATPALVQSGVITRVLDGNTTNAASTHDRQEGAGAGGQSGDAANQGADQYSGGGGREDAAGSRDGSGRDGTASPETGDTLGPTSPSCLRSQIGDGGSTVSPADEEGHVYGAFRVTNTSDASCLVDGSDTVTATPEGAADPTGFSVVAHTSGGRASKLPDPQLEPGSFVLGPGQSYLVRFAWVPREGGGTTGCPATPGPDPTAPGDSSGGTGGTDSSGGSGGSGGTGDSGGTDSSGGTGGSGGAGGSTTPPDSGQGGEGGDTVEEPTESSGISPQLAYDTGGSGSGAAAASVVLRYVPAAGEPRIGKIEITGACAGTVYRTGPIPEG